MGGRLSYREKRWAVIATQAAVDEPFVPHEVILATLAARKAELATLIKGVPDRRRRRRELNRQIAALAVAASVTPKSGIAPKLSSEPMQAPGSGVDEWRDHE